MKKLKLIYERIQNLSAIKIHIWLGVASPLIFKKLVTLHEFACHLSARKKTTQESRDSFAEPFVIDE